MSLMIWLPLNGHINNQGLLDVDLITTATPTYKDGKLGKCLHTGGIKIPAEGTEKILNNDELTIAFWVYVNADEGNTTNRELLFGNDDMTANNNRKFSLFQYPTCNDFHWSWMNDEASKTYHTGIVKGALPSYKWTHVIVVYKNPTINIYINGELKYSASGVVSNSSTFAYDTQMIYNSEYHMFNDYRIYNNAISPKEIRILSQGLMCHYPMSGEGKSPDNLISGNYQCTSTKDTFEQTGTVDCILTPDDIMNHRGDILCFSYYAYSMGDYTDNGNGASWAKTRFGIHGVFVYKNTSDSIITLYPLASNLEKGKNGGRCFECFEVPTDIKEIHTNLCFSIQTNPTYGYAKPADTNDSTWYIKDVKLEWGTSPTPWCPSKYDSLYSMLGYDDNTIYDTSGFGHHGSITSSSAPIISDDSPRYNYCYYFGNKHYIQVSDIFSSEVQIPTITVNFWVKQTNNNNGAYSTVFSWKGYGSNGIWLGANIEGSGQWSFIGGNSPNYCRGANVPKNTWMMFTYVFDNGEAYWYCNGAKISSSKVTYESKTLELKGGFCIGDNYTGSNWDTNFSGYLSDFRIYAAALSDEDVKNLYNTPVSLTNTGTLMTQGEFIEN